MTTRTKRILLAEDEVALRDFVSRNLHARGFDVLEASNGLEAMAIWEQEHPHLLILDIMMPRMDGLEVCRRVREHSAVPIIVLTALDAESDKVTALDLGADDYLTKPFGVEELLARVRAVLRRTQWEIPPPIGDIKQFGELEIDRIWGAEYGGEAEYLRVYLNRLRQKLEPDPTNPRYLLTEPGVGYRFIAPGH